MLWALQNFTSLPEVVDLKRVIWLSALIWQTKHQKCTTVEAIVITLKAISGKP